MKICETGRISHIRCLVVLGAFIEIYCIVRVSI